MTALQSQASASTCEPSSVIELRFLGEPAPQGSKVQTRWGTMREAARRLSRGVPRFNTRAVRSTKATRSRALCLLM